MLLLANRADAPRPIARAPPTIGRRREGFVTDLDRAGPIARLREAHGIEHDPAVLADVLPRFEERRNRALPGEITGEAVLRRFEDETHPLQALDHFDAERADAGVHPIAEHARGAHHVMLPPARHAGKGVLHGEVWILA